MRPSRHTKRVLGGSAIAAVLGLAIVASAAAQDEPDFGIGTPVPVSGTGVTAGPAEEAVTAASGLTVSVASDQVGLDADMIALLPDNAAPTHAGDLQRDRSGESDQASVQLVDLAAGAVTDMISGLISCDAAKRTPWGTVLVGEEESDGRVYGSARSHVRHWCDGGPGRGQYHQPERRVAPRARPAGLRRHRDPR